MSNEFKDSPMNPVMDSETEKTTELIKKVPMDNTPFTIITIDGKSFGTFGRYKITEDYENDKQVKAELEKMTWNRVIQIMTLVHTILIESETQYKNR